MKVTNLDYPGSIISSVLLLGLLMGKACSDFKNSALLLDTQHMAAYSIDALNAFHQAGL